MWKNNETKKFWFATGKQYFRFANDLHRHFDNLKLNGYISMEFECISIIDKNKIQLVGEIVSSVSIPSKQINNKQSVCIIFIEIYRHSVI